VSQRRSLSKCQRLLRAVVATIVAVAVPLLAFASPAAAASFTNGNVVVCRVGNGTAGNLSNTGSPVFLDEYTPAGVLVQSIALPTAASGSNRAFWLSGTATSECELTRSTDGRYLLLTGYERTDAGGVAGTTSAAVNRVVARVDATGLIDTTTALNDFASANNPRSVISDNGTNLWLGGAAGSPRYTTLGATTSTQISTTVTNLRQVNIFNGQLYTSTSSGSAVRVGTIGTGLPTTSGQTITNLPGFPVSGSPYSYFFADLTAAVAGLDTLYVADDGASGGQIQKYCLVSGSWVARGTIAATAVRGLTGVVTGTSVTLYATTGDGTTTGGGTLYKTTDATGYNVNASASVSTIASVTTSKSFRGVALAPVSPDQVVPEAPLVALLSLSALVLTGGVFVAARRWRPVEARANS
jgi:hypothetical protein